MLEDHLKEFRRRDKPKSKMASKIVIEGILKRIEGYIAEEKKKNASALAARRKNAPRGMSAILQKYNLSQEDFDAMINSQCGKCTICLEPQRNLFIDHDHSTGLVRSLLCHYCNSTLGFAKDDIKRLQACISYLEKHSNCQQ